jgi:hypothetical protein
VARKIEFTLLPLIAREPVLLLQNVTAWPSAQQCETRVCSSMLNVVRPRWSSTLDRKRTSDDRLPA